MNIVHAIWEKRNMGVDCYEIELGEKDSWEDFDLQRSDFESEYTVVKFPTSLFSRFGWRLQENGYHYIETMITAQKGPILPELTSVQQRMLKDSSYEFMDDEGFKELYANIDKGMFSTDRVSIDPFFTNEQSNARYKGWIRDEVERGSDVFSIKFKGRNVGFFTFKDKGNGVYDPFLGGLFQEKPVLGLGFIGDYFEIMELKKRSGKKALLHVSTNNKPAMGPLFSMGFTLETMEAVFVYHRI